MDRDGSLKWPDIPCAACDWTDTVPTPRIEECSTCRWWDRVNGKGECHRLPPAPVVCREMQGHHVEPIYPHTPPTNWCGEYIRKVDHAPTRRAVHNV